VQAVAADQAEPDSSAARVEPKQRSIAGWPNAPRPAGNGRPGATTQTLLTCEAVTVGEQAKFATIDVTWEWKDPAELDDPKDWIVQADWYPITAEFRFLLG